MSGSNQSLLRFLALIERELDAHEARLELSAHPPAPHLVSVPWQNGFRVVVAIDESRDRDEATKHLEALVESFASFASPTLAIGKEPADAASQSLEDALDLLLHRARAESVWVIDDASPVVWASTIESKVDVGRAQVIARLARTAEELGLTLRELASLGPELRARLASAGIEPARAASTEAELAELRSAPWAEALEPRWVRAMRAIASVRADVLDPAAPTFVRGFANVYRLVLVFDGPHSELHAEAATLRALPVIEKLVLALPPRDPIATGAKVSVLRRLRPV